MHKSIFTVAIAFLLATSAWSHPTPQPFPEDQGHNYDPQSFRNPVNSLYICVFNKRGDDPKSEGFLQLRESPGKRVIASLRFAGNPRFDALWSPDGKHVAITYRERQSGITQTIIYTASAMALTEIPSTRSLQLSRLLPGDDPAWKLQKYAESTQLKRWVDDRTLLLEVRGVFRSFDQGFTNIAYEVSGKILGASSLEILSAKQVEYQKDT